MDDALRDRLQSSLGATFRLVRELGGGGMSRVFLAEESALGRQVVVKVLPPELAGGVSTDRFRREISLAARLQHPHIVPLLTAGELDGVPYFTMPYVEGESLRVRLARQGELPMAAAMRMLREVASALQYAHERGVVHRDIKPDNVLLSGGSAMVTDFGVAKAVSTSSNAEHGGVTSLGIALGTPAYMSPEQAAADPTVDHRADIYAFGVLAYELLTGQPPFTGRTPQALLAAHVTEAPDPITRRRAAIPPALAALVMRCIEKRPADRPQSAGDVVHALDDITTPSGGMPPTSAVLASYDAARGTSSAPKRARAGLAIGALLLTLGASAYFALRHRGSGAAAAEMPRSVAVLPLVNASADTGSQYFVEGMTDEVTGALSRVPGLRVASRSSAASVDTRKPIDARAVGKRLGVSAVLEGRLRREGSRMRLAMQLTNTADGFSIWSETYEREARDAFEVQDEVARSIASALRLTLAGAPRPAARRTENPEAHDLVLRARFEMGRYTESSLRQAVTMLERAVALDSNYAAAWAGLVDAWGRLADDFMPPSEALAHVRPALARALALDSLNPYVLATLATTQFYYDRDLRGAGATFARALALDSTSDVAAAFYPHLLIASGRHDSAAAVVLRLQRIEPLNGLLLVYGPEELATAGRIREARELCRRALEIDPSSRCQKAILRAEKKWDALLGECQRTDDRWCMAEMLGRLGRNAEARREALLAEERFRGRYLRPVYPASAWAWAGDRGRAMAWIDRMEREQAADLSLLWWDERWSPLRGDPRFEAVLKRVAPTR